MMEDFRETVFPRHSRTEAHLNPQRLQQHAYGLQRLKQDKRSQNWDRVADSVSYPSQEAICSWCLLAKEKVFSSGASLGLQPHSQVTNFATLTPCFYLWTFCFVLAVSVLLVCCLFVLIFVFAGFAFCFCLFDVCVLKGQRYSMIRDVKYKLLIQLRRTICPRCPFANMGKKNHTLTLLYHHKWY